MLFCLCCALGLHAEVRMLVLKTEPQVADVKLIKGTFLVGHSAAVKKVFPGNEKGEPRGKETLVMIYDNARTNKEEIVFTLEKVGYHATVLADTVKPKPERVDGMTGATVN